MSIQTVFMHQGPGSAFRSHVSVQQSDKGMTITVGEANRLSSSTVAMDDADLHALAQAILAHLAGKAG